MAAGRGPFLPVVLRGTSPTATEEGDDPILTNGTGGISSSSAPTAGAPTDRSGTITTGGTRQQLAAANATRKYLFIQNLSNNDMYVNFGVNAVQGQPSKLIGPRGSLTFEGSFVPNTAVDIISPTTADAFAAMEF